MRSTRWLAVLAFGLGLTGLHAQDLADTCHASSSFDVTVSPDAISFDRPAPAPRRVELQDGSLRTDDAVVRLNAEDQDRLRLFERQLRQLLPRVRAVAIQGVDLAVQGVHDESAGLSLGASTRQQLDQRLAVDATALKQRIARSDSTHDWQGQGFNHYAEQVMGDIGPLIAGDLGQQALQAAMSGDLQGAASLRDRAAELAEQLRPRMERRMQALRPQIQALCPAVRQLYELQQGVPNALGQPLNLMHWQS